MKLNSANINKEKANSSIFDSKLPRIPNIKVKSPGPGFYKPQEMIRKIDYNKKGNGNGFLSKVDRGEIRKVNESPGPGYYTMPHSTNFMQNSSSFKVSKNKNNFKKVEIFPGPGDYTLEKSSSFKNLNPTSSLESKSKRLFENTFTNCIPAPGKYNPYSYEDQRATKLKKTGESLEAIRGKRLEEIKEKEFQRKIILEIRRDFHSSGKEDLRSEGKVMGKLYKKPSFHCQRKVTESRFDSLMIQKRIPSPGKYELTVPNYMVNNIGSVVFKSESKRFSP